MICEQCGIRQESKENTQDYYVIENDYAELTITGLHIVKKSLIKKKTMVNTDVFVTPNNSMAYSKSAVFETYQEAVDWLRNKTTKLQMRSALVTGWQAIIEGEK